MPFIARCPYCNRYMLLEDTQRGARVPCLLCKKTIEVGLSGSGDTPTPAADTPSPIQMSRAAAATVSGSIARSEQGRQAASQGAYSQPPVPGMPPLPAAGPKSASAPVAPARSGAAPVAATAQPKKRQGVLNCPNCNALLALPAGAAGKSLRCPKCQRLFSTQGM